MAGSGSKAPGPATSPRKRHVWIYNVAILRARLACLAPSSPPRIAHASPPSQLMPPFLSLPRPTTNR